MLYRLIDPKVNVLDTYKQISEEKGRGTNYTADYQATSHKSNVPATGYSHLRLNGYNRDF